MKAEVIQHIENSLSQIRDIFVKAATRIETIKPGEKIPATALAEELAKEIGSTGPALYPTLLFLYKGYPEIVIKKGAHGGLCRLKLPEINLEQNSNKE